MKTYYWLLYLFLLPICWACRSSATLRDGPCGGGFDDYGDGIKIGRVAVTEYRLTTEDDCSKAATEYLKTCDYCRLTHLGSGQGYSIEQPRKGECEAREVRFVTAATKSTIEFFEVKQSWLVGDEKRIAKAIEKLKKEGAKEKEGLTSYKEPISGKTIWRVVMQVEGGKSTTGVFGRILKRRTLPTTDDTFGLIINPPYP